MNGDGGAHGHDGRAHGAPLRVGVVLGAGPQPRWIAELLREVATGDVGTLALVVRPATDAAASDARHRWLARLAAERHHWLFQLYSGVDRLLFPVDPDPTALVPVEQTLAGHPTMTTAGAVSADGRLALTRDDAAAIRAHALDVVLALVPVAAEPGEPDLARYGVWSYRHGSRGATNGAAGVDEVLEGKPVTPAALCVTARGATREVYAAWVRTEKRSVNRNRAACYRKAVALFGRTLRDVHERGAAALDGPALAPDVVAAAPATTPPRNAETLRALSRMARGYASRRLRHRDAPGDWFVAYHIGPRRHDAAPGDDLVRSDFERFTQLHAPPGRFWADPFPVVRDGRYYVFVEDYAHATRKGHIGVLDVTPGSESRDAVPVLDRPYHLSYPFVFRWRGEDFMMPESVHDSGVDLFRATRFPYEWEHHARLLDGVRAVDATLCEAEGRWWMFTNIAQRSATAWPEWNEELHLFHAPSPLGPWTPHRRNPVKCDVRGSRPAGMLFRRFGALYRPSQDCSERYGGAITVSRVERLDDEAFREVEVARIEPRWSPDLVGTHTLNHADGLTVIDGRERRQQRWPRDVRTPSARAPSTAASSSARRPPRSPGR